MNNDTTIKTSLVVSSNDLVHAKYDLSLWQKRVFIYAISQLEKEDKEFKSIKIFVADIIKFFKASDGVKSYNAILDAPKNLDKTIEVPYTTSEGFLRYGYVKLLQKYTIPADGENANQYIEIQFNSELQPHLLELKEKFLKYDIRNIIELQSTYSFRMFEILKSYEYRKSIEFDLEKLKDILEVKNKYTQYNDFRKYVIDKSQRDLSKFCDITFDYEEIKALKGKRIASIRFHIKKNNVQRSEPSVAVPMDRSLIILEQNSSQHKPEDERLIVELSPIVVTQFGVNLKVFMNLVENHPELNIRQAIKVTENALKVGKITNAAGFFVEAVRGHYAEVEDKKKLLEVEKKAKIEAVKKTEQNEQQTKEQAKRAIGELKINKLKTLIGEKAVLIDLSLAEFQRGQFANYFDKTKSLLENMDSPAFAGAMMYIAEKLDPSVFDAL